MFCWNCGEELTEDTQICGKCGARAFRGDLPISEAADDIKEKSDTLGDASDAQKDSGTPDSPNDTPNAQEIADGPDDASDVQEDSGTPDSSSDTPNAQKISDDPDDVSDAQEDSSTPGSSSDTPNAQKISDGPDDAPDTQENSGTPDSSSDAQEKSGTPGNASSDHEAPAQDLVIRRKHIFLSGTQLTINGTYYQKKRRHFKKKKGQLDLPLSSVTQAAPFHSHSGRRAIVALLLSAVLAAGALAAGSCGLESRRSMDIPFCQDRILELEDSLARLEGSADTDLAALQAQLTDACSQQEQLKQQMAEYQNQQRQEQLRRAVSDLSLDYSLILADDFFADAYDEYISDLLEIFKNDSLLDSWLYPYYTYTLERGENRYISEAKNLDMWFYDIPGGRHKFSAEAEDLEALEFARQDFTLYDRLYYHGRIYITASDFMNTVLCMPNYVADSAVFVKAFGGDPDPSSMSVPGWNDAVFDLFWSSSESYYSLDVPVWVEYHLSAEDFSLDWNQLVDEQAYYDAYQKFMNTIAPGLDTYDMVTYYASDDAYGGMGFDITGKEASATEIIALYLENHPDALEQFDIDLNAVPTAYDIPIQNTQAEIEELTVKTAELEQECSEMAGFLENGDSMRAEYDSLMAERQKRQQELKRNFLAFSGIAVILALPALIFFLSFLRNLRRPKHLMALTVNDGSTIAFSTAFCSKKALEELKGRLSTPCQQAEASPRG